MTRVEIIANQSVQDIIINGLEGGLKDFLYTLIPLAYGRGKADRKLGTSTWPETNFVLVAYVKDEEIQTVLSLIKQIKKKFHDEGVRMFWIRSAEDESDGK